MITVVNIYFRSLIPPMLILNVAKLAFIIKSYLAGLLYLVKLSPLGGIRDLKYTSSEMFTVDMVHVFKLNIKCVKRKKHEILSNL